MHDKLFYIHGDEIRTVPKTPNRAKAVSNLFFEDERQAYMALKLIIEKRIQKDSHQLLTIEHQLTQLQEKS